MSLSAGRLRIGPEAGTSQRESVRAIRRVMPLNRVAVHRRRPPNVVHVSCYSQRWPSLLPRHGPGLKHTRSIELQDWQREITHAFPEMLIGPKR